MWYEKGRCCYLCNNSGIVPVFSFRQRRTEDGKSMYPYEEICACTCRFAKHAKHLETKEELYTPFDKKFTETQFPFTPEIMLARKGFVDYMEVYYVNMIYNRQQFHTTGKARVVINQDWYDKLIPPKEGRLPYAE